MDKVDGQKITEHFPSLYRDGSVTRIETLAGDISPRRYYRIYTERGTAVLQIADVFDESKKDQHAFLSGQRVLEGVGVDVPKILGTCGKEGWILLEDLGDELFQKHKSEAGYKKALAYTLHWIFDARKEKFATPHFGWAFDFEKLQAEMKFTADHFVEGLCGGGGARYLAQVKHNSQWLSDRPRYYCHRDYHCRNLLVSGSRMAVIDFQDARLGPVTYDVASLLWDPYAELSPAQRQSLVTWWRNELRERAKKEKRNDLLKATDDDLFTEELHRMVVQRLLKAVGSYAAFYRNRQRKDYLPNIVPALRDVISSLEALQKMAKLRSEESELLQGLIVLTASPPAILKG